MSFQILALLVAFSGVRAQSAAAQAAVASARSQHNNGAAFVGGSLQPLGLTDASHGTDHRGSGFYTSPAAQSNTVLNSGLVTPTQSDSAVSESFASVPAATTATTTMTTMTAVTTSLSASAGSGSASSQGFTFTAPGDTFGILIQPNEPAITQNNLFPPLFNTMRTGSPADFNEHPSPGAVGSNLDTRGANYFEASVAPYWVFARNSRYPVTVTLPAQVMMGDDPYYFGHHYGWISAGVNVRVPLAFIPRQCGKWSAGTSADLCYYGTTTAEFTKSVGLQMPKLGAAISLEL